MIAAPFRRALPGLAVLPAAWIVAAAAGTPPAADPDGRSAAAGSAAAGSAASGSAASGSAAARQEPGAPSRIVLFVGDGVGLAYWTSVLVRRDALAVAGFPVVGLLDSRNADGRVTDSAAAATAFATGLLTFNGSIGLGPDSAAVPTVLDAARRRGRATGLVATSRLTHATPAAFVAHVPDRWMEEEIAAQMASAEVDVLLGGGRAYFDGSIRRDGRDLLRGLRRRYAYVSDAPGLRSLDLDTVPRLLGLFAERDPPPAAARRPGLAELTEAALRVLDRDPDGFFLMVEASQPDWVGHDGKDLQALASEMLDFDEAIGAGLRYLDRRPDALLVVVSDHETGGLAVAEDGAGELVAAWATGLSGRLSDHTADLVPIFAAGPGAERFRGLLTAADVGRILLELAGGGPAADRTGGA